MITSPTPPATDPVWTPVHDRQLLTLQVAELYRFAPVMAASSFFGALLTLAVFFDDKHLGAGLYWFAFATAIVLYRIAVIVAYEHRKRDAPALWANCAIVGNLLAGVKWGLLGTVLFPSEHGYREIFAIMLITSYVGGSITAYAAVKWAHPALSLPAAVPASVYLFFFHDGMHVAAGTAALFLTAATVYFAMKEHRLIEKRLRLVIQNHHLVHQLHHTNARLVSENRNLAHRAAVRLKRARSAQGRATLLAMHFAHSPLPMLECDTHYRLLDWNAAAVAAFGLLEEELMGRSIIDNLLTPASRETRRESLMRMVHERTPASLTAELHNGSGGVLAATLHVTPVYPDDGTAARVAVVICGLTLRDGTDSNGQLRHAA